MKTPRDTRVALLYKQHRKNSGTLICDGCGFAQPMLEGPNGRAIWKRIFHAHHVVPLQFGGADEGDNLALLCLNCHAIVHAFYSADESGRWTGASTRQELRFTFAFFWAIDLLQRKEPASG